MTNSNGVLYPTILEIPGSSDVGNSFHIIFLIGFIVQCVTTVYILAGLAYVLTGTDSFLKGVSGLMCCSGLLSFGWIIYASIVIFSEEGQLCRETLLPKSGQFIYVYVIMFYSIIGLFCLCGCCLGVAATARG